MANITSFDDLSESEDQDVSCSIDVFDETSQDVCKKNLLEDFAADAKLTRQSVAHGREHMQVHLRIRPFTATEKEKGESQDCMETKEPSTLLMRAPKDSFTFKSSQRGFSNMTHKFTFSRIFGEDTSQKDFFDETMLLTVKDFIDGQNCLVFTYGVTNAGKTYTIQGVPQDGGILPRSLDVIFNSIEGKHYTSMQLKPRYFCDVTKLTERQLRKEEEIRDSVLTMAANALKQENSVTDENDDSRGSNYTTATEDSRSDFSFQNLSNDSVPNVLEDIRCRIPDDTSIDVEAQGPVRFSIWVSFAEIYNEYIYDLLEAIPKGKKVRRQPLKLSEDKNGQIYIKGLKEIYCRSADEAYKILKIGQKNLSIAATKLNQCSSRSHCIFSVKILRVVDVDNPHVARVSKLSFCDLAGSERYTRTQNTGERLKEAGNINTSLLTLGKCIHTLRYNQNHPKTHPKIIPFRESKLTRLFQTFFMGKGKASMIVNVNQCASGFDETIHVLKFSAIAKQVTTITSKLDNKWKIPAAPPKYPSSRDLSLAINQALPRNRVSVAWATPGYNPDSNLDLTTVEETFIEEDEENDETDEDDEEGDVETTPKDSRSKLVSLVESLKSQLIESKKLQMMMEVQIRAEVCQEMSQQLVQIESEYKDRMEEERMINEEMYEKRLEMYERSVKKPRKRPHTETDTDDEFVSSLLLHAEQVKVQEQAKTITSLRGDVQKLKDTLDETEEKMNVQDQTSSELQSLIETSSQTLEEAKAKMCAKDQKLLYMETKLKEAHDALAHKEKEANKLTANTSEIVSTLESKIENLQNDLEVQQARVDDLQKELANSDKERQEEKEEKEDNLQSALVHKEKEAKELAANTSEIVSTLESKIENLQNDLEVQQARVDDLQKELANRDKERQEEKEEKEDNVQSALAQKEEMAKELAANTSEIVSTLESKIENLQNDLEVQLARVDDLQKELASSNKERQHKKDNLQSALAHKEEEAKELAANTSEIVSTLESKIENLQNNLEVQLARVDDLQKELANSNKERQEEKEEKEDNLQAALAHKEEEATELAANTSEIVSKLESKIEDLQNDLEVQQARFDDLQKELAKSNKERQEEKEEKEDNVQSGMELEKSLNKTREEAEKYKTEFDELKKKHEFELQSFRDELKASSKTLVRVGLQIEKEKQKSFDAEEKIVDLEEQLSSLNKETNQSSKDSEEEKEKILTLEKSIKEHQDKLSKQEKSTDNCKATIQSLESQLVKKEELEKSIKDLEEDLDDLQTRFDQTNTKGQEATVRAAALENDLEYLKEEIKMEQKAHNDTKMVASDYGCQVSLLRSQLETAERTTASSNGLAKRNKELQGNLNEMQRTLTEKEIALAEASKWQGNATDLRSQLKTLDDKIKQTEQERSAAEATVQNLSQQCTGLQQSLAQKENETVEIQQLKDQQKTIEEHCQGLAKSLEDQKVKTKSKADSIKQLMTEIEMQCHKLQAAEKDARANSEVISVLKAGMQEQEATMASQDEILASKELELDSLRKELTDLQDRHSELHTVSSENRQAVRESNKNHEQFKREKESMRRELEETLSKLHEIERENEEHKKKHEDTKAALSDYVKEKRAVEGDCEKLRGQLQESKTSLAEAQLHPQDCPEKIANQNLMKKITALEQEVMKQVADKDETLKKWREEKDNLVRALQAKMESLLADSKAKETLLEEKDKHIKHLKNKMVENITASQSVTDDDSDSEDTSRGSGKRNKGVQRELQQLTELLEKEREDTKTAQTSSKRAISELEEANRTLQTQLGLIEHVSIDIKPLRSSDLDSSPKDASSSPCGQPESPDLFALEVKDQESFSLPGRRRTRVQMDMTPLQKKQPARKGRANTRRTKKRKSMEEMEEFNDDTYGKRNRGEDGSSRVTRSSRKTRTQRGEEEFVDENVMDGKLPEAPLTSGRGKRAALSKIGDMLQNSPIAKSASSSIKSSSRSQPSAKKFVETATSHMTSPTKSPEVQIVSYHPPPTTEKKRKRRLQKIDISAPFQSSPFEMVNHGETRGDSSHSIVTRKLRSRNTRV